MKHKLIIFEGLPGSGKSSFAQKVHCLLQDRGEAGHLYCEGNLDHPADYESTACLNDEQYSNLASKYGEYREVLLSYTTKKDDDYFVSIGKLSRHNLSDLCSDLSEFSTYGKLPWEKEKEIMLDYWREFAEKAQKSECYTIFECCFLQNQICELMARFNKPETEIYEQIKAITEIILPLSPLVVYFENGNVRERLDEIKSTRPREWLDFVIDYHTNQGYGLANNLKGYDGLIEFYIQRQKIEKSILNRLPIDKLFVLDGYKDWEQSYSLIKDNYEGSSQTIAPPKKLVLSHVERSMSKVDP